MSWRKWLPLLPFFGSLALLILIGLLNQYSAGGKNYFLRQVIWTFLGIGVFTFFFLSNYRKLLNSLITITAYLLVTGVLGVLALLHMRWIYFYKFALQPSEFAKPAVVLLLSTIAHTMTGPSLLLCSLLVAIPGLLIAVTDLDQAFLVLIIGFTHMLFLGIPRRVLVLGCVLGLAGLFVVGPMVWNSLKPYQRARLVAFFKPGKTQKRWSYQTEQALIAVGSGGLFGQGFKKGLSSKLHYLPAKHTDLAFAVWAEELGFVGSATVLVLFGVLVGSMLKCAYSLKEDPSGGILLVGAASMIFWEVFFNLGGVVQLLPAASIPLPFLSYGGSSMLSNMIMLGIAASVMRTRVSFT